MNFSAEKSGERKQMNKLIYINNFVVIGFSIEWKTFIELDEQR